MRQPRWSHIGNRWYGRENTFHRSNKLLWGFTLYLDRHEQRWNLKYYFVYPGTRCVVFCICLAVRRRKGQLEYKFNKTGHAHRLLPAVDVILGTATSRPLQSWPTVCILCRTHRNCRVAAVYRSVRPAVRCDAASYRRVESLHMLRRTASAAGKLSRFHISECWMKFFAFDTVYQSYS